MTQILNSNHILDPMMENDILLTSPAFSLRQRLIAICILYYTTLLFKVITLKYTLNAASHLTGFLWTSLCGWNKMSLLRSYQMVDRVTVCNFGIFSIHSICSAWIKIRPTMSQIKYWSPDTLLSVKFHFPGASYKCSVIFLQLFWDQCTWALCFVLSLTHL